jgi:hypothetical protein
MKKTRDTTGKLGVDQAARALKRLEKTLEKRVARLPEGRYAIVVSAIVSEGRGNATGAAFRVLGDRVLKEAIEAHAAEVQHTASQLDSLPSSDFFMMMPGNAEDRARRLRRILAMAWNLHVEKTSFKNTKQMYDVVRKKPDIAFPWWDEVAGVPFVNNAIDNAGVSERVFKYIAPRVLRSLREKENLRSARPTL